MPEAKKEKLEQNVGVRVFSREPLSDGENQTTESYFEREKKKKLGFEESFTETSESSSEEKPPSEEKMSIDNDEDNEELSIIFEELLTYSEEYLTSQIHSWLSEADRLTSQLKDINRAIDATRTPEGNLSVDSLPLMDLKRKYEKKASGILLKLWDEEIREMVGDWPREASRELYELVNPPPTQGVRRIEIPPWVDRNNPQELEQFIESAGTRSSGK
ncbi:TPA: hypothetical protein EYP70_04085 [Candidatus Bathyarchaeota archaeon]|nr:hypothetical protein [Candidatus Bathyarchaeota archaeon]